MENTFSPLFPNSGNNATNGSNQNMGSQSSSLSFSTEPFSYSSTPSNTFSGPFSYSSTPSNSSNQSYYYPSHYHIPPPCQGMQFQYAYPVEQANQYSPAPYPFNPFWFGQNGIETRSSCFLQPNGLMAQERRLCDAYKTKLARSQRKLARQKSLTRNSSSATNSTQLDTRRLVLNAPRNLQDNKPTSSISSDLFKFCTPDNKKLRFLLTKDLKNSDVGSLGRIVLPKREVEENLPVLSDKEGIRIVIRDVYSSKEWNLKFKYWSNNKSRMYVLENTGDFVKQNRLETGDSLTLYEDENKNLYFSIKKVEKPAADTNNNPHIPHTYEARDEEEASLALLIEQLKHQEQQEEAHSLSTLSLGAAFSYGHGEKAKHSASSNYVTGVSNVLQPTAAAMQQSSSPKSKMRVVDDHHIDDWLHFPWQSPRSPYV